MSNTPLFDDDLIAVVYDEDLPAKKVNVIWTGLTMGLSNGKWV